jgi:hypothetical protein
MVFPPNSIVRILKSTPIVEMYDSVNVSSANLSNRQLFPTPESRTPQTYFFFVIWDTLFYFNGTFVCTRHISVSLRNSSSNNYCKLNYCTNRRYLAFGNEKNSLGTSSKSRNYFEMRRNGWKFVRDEKIESHVHSLLTGFAILRRMICCRIVRLLSRILRIL